MKSIKTGMIAASLAVGLLTLAPARIQAQPTKLLITLTATYQDPNPRTPPASNPNITPSDTKTGKLTSANIITDLTTADSIPAGSFLSYDPDLSGGTGAIGGMTAGAAGTFTDVSSQLSISTDAGGNGALTASSTEDTTDSPEPAQSIVYTSDWAMTFDDGNGNSFTVNGVVKLTASLAKLTAAQNTAGDPQTETISYSGSVSGYGTYMGNPAVFTGTVSGSGKGPQGS